MNSLDGESDTKSNEINQILRTSSDRYFNHGFLLLSWILDILKEGRTEMIKELREDLIDIREAGPIESRKLKREKKWPMLHDQNP